MGISEGEKVMLGNKKMNQVDTFNHLGSIVSKDDGCSEDVKSRRAKAKGTFSQLKKGLQKD